MMDKATCKDSESLRTLLGLAATKEKPVDECPPPEVFMAFIDERLPKAQHQRFLSHLNQCEHCYQEWLDVSLALEESQTADISVPAGKKSWWSRVREFCRFRPWLPPLTTAVALTFAVMAVILYRPVDNRPTSELVALVMEQPGIESALKRLPLSSHAPFAFSDTGQDLAKQAFSAGFREALQYFDKASVVQYGDQGQGKQQSWQHQPWRDYYQLGQWALLTWLLTQSEGVTAEKWREFDRYCIDFIERFEKMPEDPAAKRALGSLREMHGFMQVLSQHPDSAQQSRLARKLKLTIQQWLS